ncbi:MAG: DNA topoisomerase I [Nanoarchaeota archaeon]|nr:DNA topoisomerase I [Nanoarchaeota archaeon]
MGYTLIITEKPSAAQKMANALTEGKVDKTTKGKISYYKIKRGGKDIMIVSAVGHLFVMDEKDTKVKWSYPVFDVDWKPTYLRKGNLWAKPYFDNIKSLVKGASDFISACDYDIEGSVIAFNILRFICGTEKGKRMKFSTLTEEDLIEAYEKASPKLDFPQIEAGLTRHQLDWYFGINLSRALTLSIEHAGGFWTLSTGRVQGPTLKLLEDREKEIRKFVPKPFWEIELKCLLGGKIVAAQHENDKFWKKDEASKIFEKCKGKDGIVNDVTKKEVKQNPPFPFDLTTLQRDSYNLFGYSPKMTLDVAQTLYEHALISYPRTSSQKLPAKIGFKKILTDLSKQEEYAGLCEKLLSKPILKPNEGNKIDSAHPSIFPTGVLPKKLNSYQKKVYDLIVKRFFAVFNDAAVREQMRVKIDVNKEIFVTHGIRTLKANWMDFYKPYAKFKEQVLPDVEKDDHVKIKNIDMFDKETEPPNRYSQASILKKMDDLGLGTKATRAGILHTLYERGYVRDSSINVTKLGEAVTSELEKYCPEIISIELTKRFDEDMDNIQAGKEKREKIIKDAEKELIKILTNFKKHEKEIGEELKKAVKDYEHKLHTLGKCNKCGGELHIIHSPATHKRFVGCTGYPKCSNSFPLPQMGYVEATKQKCKDCGLFTVLLKSKGRRPWNFCAKCGFEKWKKEQDEKKKASGAKPATPAKTEVKKVVKKRVKKK